MYFRIIATLALSFVFYIGSSQVSYHRLYETTLNDPSGMNDTTFFLMSSATISGDVVAMGTKRVGEAPTDFDDLTLVFTKHDQKGDITWSKELDLGQDTVDIIGQGNIEYNGALDSILFTIEVEINGEQKELFGRLDRDGNNIDLRTVGGNELALINRTPDVAPFINESDLLLTPGVDPTISRIGFGDDLIWSRKYEFMNSGGDNALSFVTDITTTEDSTILISGYGDGLGEEFVVAELDSNGVQLWAESYTFSINNLILIYPREVEPLSNGNFAVAGFYQTSPAIQSNGFVAVIDTAGSILMAKKLFINENSTEAGNLLEGDDGSLWISGIYNSQDSSHYFTTNMTTDGEVNWTTIYPGQEAEFNLSTTDLLGVQLTGGASLVGHGILDDLSVLRVIRHDAAGDAMCSDTIPIMLEDLVVTADTLTTSVENGGIFFDSLDFELSTFIGFTPPVLSITQYPNFCPNEFIDTFLVASVSGVADENITYKWSTEETTDTIRIQVLPMETPEYSVTVTISEDVCYMMCDTIQISRYELPQAQIGIDNSRYCDEKLFVLNAEYTPGAGEPTYLWSTGETTPAIDVSTEGQYSVTITDECNEPAEAEITVGFPDPLELTITESSTFNILCTDGGHRLSALLVGGIAPPSYEWSTGESGFQIVAMTNGTYTVTATDACGDMLIESIDVEVDQIPTEGEITFELDCNEEDNALSRITFNASTNVDNAVVELNVFDAEDLSVLISQDVIPSNPLVLGNYYAVLTTCDNVELATLTVNASALCGGLLRYPIAFFPGGQDEDSQKFGPIPNDTMSVENIITDLEFKVFNRWGETVFESNDLLESWDGTHKGEPAPSEVYIWYVSYMVEGVEMLDKGDVTLIR